MSTRRKISALRSYSIVLAVAVGAPMGGLHAQEVAPMVTDRPDQTESSSTVQPGSIQIEGGWTFSEMSDGLVRLRGHSIPELLLRIGAAPNVEIRLGFAGWQREEVSSQLQSMSASGVGDLDVGFKYRFAQGGADGVSAAVMGTITLPTGGQGFTSDRVEPTLRFSAEKDLSEKLGLGLNMGASVSTEEDALGLKDSEVDLLYTAVLGFSLTERIGAFVESFGFVGASGERDDRHLLDGGFTFSVSPAFQLDVNGGFGLNAASDDWFVGAGISARFPR